jgi:hypothetical protein
MLRHRPHESNATLTVINSVLNGSQSIANGILSLSQGVLVGSLEENGDRLGVLAFFYERELFLALEISN